PAPAGLRGPHALGDRLPGRGRRRLGRGAARARLLRFLRSGRAGPRRDRRHAPESRSGVGRDRIAAGAGPGSRLRVRLALAQHPDRPRLAALRDLPRDHPLAGARAPCGGSRDGRGHGLRCPSAVLRVGRLRRRQGERRAGPPPRPRLPARPGPLGRGDEPDHRRAARLRAARHAGGDRPPVDPSAVARADARGCDGAGGDLGRACTRLLLDLPGRLLRDLALVWRLRARPDRDPLMFAQEFMRNALFAGTFVGLACGLVGYFVVLRAQVFAGDALSHVAFTGALGAAALGLDLLAGVFVATICGGLLIGLLGKRARADDVTIGSLFAWTLGLGALFLAIFTTQRSGSGNGAAGVRVLFGSIFGLDGHDVRVSVAIALAAAVALLAIARPLLFSSLDEGVAEAQGVPVRALGLLFLALLGVVAAEATQAIGALLLLGLLAAPAGAAQRLTTRPWLGL